MAFGVTIAGFIKPTDNERKSDLAEKFRAKFGQDVTLSPNSYLGEEYPILDEVTKEFWGYLEGVYYAVYPTTATGVNLDRAAFPFVRNDAKKSSVLLTFTGQDGAAIPTGSIAETADGVQYETVEDAEIFDTSGGESSVVVNAVAINAGSAGNQPVGAINVLPVTITDIDSVTNEQPAIGGEDVESDADFVSRIETEAQETKSSSVPAIRAAVLAVDGVTQVNVVENDTDEIVDGLEPNSIYVVVAGTGSDADIANAIFASKAGGIGTNGAESYVVTLGTEQYTINFDRAATVNIYVDLILTVDATWSSDSISKLKLRVLQYIGGVDNDGVSYPGLLSGQDVLAWKVVASLFNLGQEDDLGILDVSVELSKFTDPSSTEDDNISIAATEKAITDLSFISVTVL
jgi:uncharacterized phage protein gp47/JayE